jgi:hypothetical protein
LESGSDYQQKRLGAQYMLDRRNFYRELEEVGGTPSGALFNLLEVVTFSYFEGRRDGQDGEVVAALQALRRTLSPLHVPSGPIPVFAEHLRKEYEAFKKQNSEQIPDASAGPEVVDRVSQFVATFSGKDLQSHRFLGGLIGYVKTYHPLIAEALKKKQEGGHIVIPGQSLPLSSSEGHIHGPECGHHHA